MTSVIRPLLDLRTNSTGMAGPSGCHFPPGFQIHGLRSLSSAAASAEFGGLAQMIAGLQEMKTGNNFGYCAFTAYGCFWIALALLLIGNQYNIYVSNKTDIGWFLVAWTGFTAILRVGSLRLNGALGLTFTLVCTENLNPNVAVVEPAEKRV